MVRETVLTKNDLIYALFVVPGKNVNKPVKSMPGVFQLSVENLVKECKEVREIGIPAVILFGIPEHKDEKGSDGFDAVVTIRSHKLHIVKGFLMYLTAVIQTIILNHDPAKLQIETEKEKWETSALMVTLCNGPREGGGFMLSPNSKNDDGTMEFVIVNKVSRAMMFRLVPEFMNGTHMRFDQVRMGEYKKFALTSDHPLYIHADGEIFSGPGTDIREVSFEILPNALKIVRGELCSTDYSLRL